MNAGIQKCRMAVLLVVAVATLRGDEALDLRLLDFTVIAVDDHGQPVNGLTSDDFQVTDAGKRRPIAFFRHNADNQAKTSVLGPNEFSNRGNTGSQPVTLILFDLLNEKFGTRGSAANELIHSLEGMESAEGLYLYILTVEGRIFAVHGLTGPEVAAAEHNTIPWTRDIKTLLNDALRVVVHNRPVDIEEDVNFRVQVTLNALDSIALQLSMLPGRKNVVWVTDGVPLALGPRRSDTGDFVDFTPQLRQLSDVFDRSGTAIYPVQQIMLGSPNAMSGGNGEESHATLEELAALTGGRSNGGKDIGAAVRQSIRDLRSGYQIGYYTQPQNWDGKFHKLRIACTRKGVRIQARSGYYALPEPQGTRTKRAIEAASATAFDAGEIGIRGSVSPDSTDPQEVRIWLNIDANGIVLAQKGEQYTGQLRIAMISYLSDGRTASSSIIPLDLHYSPAERDNSLKTGIGVAQDLTIQKGVNRLRFVVFDRGSNMIGSLTVPVGSNSGR